MSVQEITYDRVILDPASAQYMLAERRRLGHDRFDEVWNGEYRMVAAPGSEHDRIDEELHYFLSSVVRKSRLGRVAMLNVGRPGKKDRDYRIPDRIFVSAERIAEVITEWGCEGAPDFAVEIRSPGDDTYLKIPFYGEIGVRELLVLRGKSKWVELFRNFDGALMAVTPASDGWLRLETLPVEIRSITKPDGAPGVEARDTRDAALSVVI